MPTSRILIVLIDKDPQIQQQIRTVLDNIEKSLAISIQLLTCSRARQLKSVVRKNGKKHPNLCILDVQPLREFGFELIEKIEKAYRRSKILVHSELDEFVAAEAALRMGADGYVMKSESHRLHAAIRDILGGETYLSDKMAKKIMADLIGRFPTDHWRNHLPHKVLSGVEFKLFTLLGKRFDFDHISKKLGLTRNQIEQGRAAIKEKLDLDSDEDIEINYLRTLGLEDVDETKQ